jgi:hypothetical protein
MACSARQQEDPRQDLLARTLDITFTFVFLLYPCVPATTHPPLFASRVRRCGRARRLATLRGRGQLN